MWWLNCGPPIRLLAMMWAAEDLAPSKLGLTPSWRPRPNAVGDLLGRVHVIELKIIG
jgi:hypothetical protein